jgi:hypothetical protein
MSYWSVPRLWPGRTVAILASGPSMSQAVADQVHAAGIPAIAINDTYRLAPWADMLYAADEAWWLRHPAALDFAGLKVSVGTIKGVHRLRNTGVTGFDPDPGCLRTGSNSGYQAVHIAAHAGASRILLCGFDMQGAHFFGRHPNGLANTGPDLFLKFRRHFGELAMVLAGCGAEVLNCTPGSALTCFPTAPLEQALAACAELTA